jgi:YfiH family protein
VLERRTLQEGIAALVSKRLEADGFIVAFTERTGGTSRRPFESLNLGLRTADRPDRVVENRGLACAAIGVGPFACGEQVHGYRISRVGPKGAGAGFAQAHAALPGADGLVTTSRNVPLAVLAADCLPIALVDPGAGRVAVVHAGWRGVAGGILMRAVRLFAEPAALRAVIGPAIGPDHYEVKEDVALAVSAASTGGGITRKEGGRIFLDLPGTAARILKELGVRRIDRAEECTACEAGRFFSHRRDGETGRQALIAMRMG